MDDSWSSLITTSLAHFANDGGGYVFITLLPVLPIPGTFLIGSLGALQNLFSVISSPIIGKRADSGRDYGNLLAIGLSLVGIAVIGYSVAILFTTGFSLFLFLLPFAILGGIGSSFYHPLGASVLYEKWRDSSLGRAMGINGAAGSLGRALYPVIIVGLVTYLTMPSVVAIAFATFVIAIVINHNFRRMSFSKPKDLVLGKNNRTPLSAIIPKIFGLTSVAFTRGIFAMGLVYWLTLYLKNVRNFGYVLDGAVFSLVLAMAVLGQPTFGYLADKIGRRLALGLSVLISALAMIGFLSLTNQILSVFLLAIFGFTALTGFPLLLPIAISIAPKGTETMSSSIVWGVGNVGGGAVGPFLIGILAEPAFLGSLAGGFFVVIAIGLMGLAILPFVPKVDARKIFPPNS